MDGKKWYLSKTVWAGILEILIAVGLALASFLDVGDFTTPAVIMFVVGVVTIILRFLTEQPLVL